MKVFLNRALLIMAGAESASNVGNWIAMIAIYMILIWQKGGGVGQSAAIYLAGLGPTMLLGPVAGWLCDRFDRRRLMIVSELLSGLCIAGMMLTSGTGWIYALLVAQSVCGTVMAPARSTVVPDVVAAEDLTRANAFLIQLNGLTRIGAPLIAALVISVVAPRTALLLDVISFLVSAAILSLLPKLPPRRERPRQESGPRASLLQTLRSVYRQVPEVRHLFPIMFSLGLMLIAFDIASAVYVRDVMRASIAFKGVIASVIGAGMGLAALALMLLKGRRNVWRDYITGALLLICLPGAYALGTVTGHLFLARAVVLAGCLLGGMGSGVAGVQGQVLMQRIAPEGWLGRFSGALQSVVVAGQITGMFLTPLLVPDVVSFGVYFGVGAAVLLLIAVQAGLALGVWRRDAHHTADEVAHGD
jgi:MFS family permease